jgi:hypothetical protein
VLDGFPQICYAAKQLDILCKMDCKAMMVARMKFEDASCKEPGAFAPAGCAPAPIAAQVALLLEYFPRLKEVMGAEGKEIFPRREERELPPESEMWTVIPRWQDLAPEYGGALRLVLGKLGEVYGLEDWLGALAEDEESFCRLYKCRKAFQKIEERQKGRLFLLIPVLTQEYRGCTFKDVYQAWTKPEFGLDLFALGILFLTQRHFFQAMGSFGYGCLGSRYAPRGDGDFSESLFLFLAPDGKLLLRRRKVSDPGDKSIGSASGFVLEQ